MDTNVAPAVDPNFDYWDAGFSWSWGAPAQLGDNVEVSYRDVIEVLYDGLEPKY